MQIIEFIKNGMQIIEFNKNDMQIVEVKTANLWPLLSFKSEFLKI